MHEQDLVLGKHRRQAMPNLTLSWTSLLSWLRAMWKTPTLAVTVSLLLDSDT